MRKKQIALFQSKDGTVDTIILVTYLETVWPSIPVKTL